MLPCDVTSVQLSASRIYLSSTLTWNSFPSVTHMIKFWEYEKPRLLWTLKKLVGHRYLVSGIYGSRFIYTCLYMSSRGKDWIAWRRRCCNLKLNWGAFHWDVSCYNDRAELTQNHFSAFIYKFVTLIVKSEHFKAVMKRTPWYPALLLKGRARDTKISTTLEKNKRPCIVKSVSSQHNILNPP